MTGSRTEVRPRPRSLSGRDLESLLAPAARALVPGQRGRSAVRVGWVLAVAGLALATLGPSGSLVLLGVVVLSSGLRRALILTATAAAASAVLVEALVLLGALMVAPLLGSGELGPLRAAFVLLVPVLVGAGLHHFRAGRADDRREGDPEVPVRWILVAVLTAAWAVGRTRTDGGVAWAMSGDGRNHVELLRSVVEDGGITISGLLQYPVMANAVAACLSALSGPGDGAAGALLVQDATAVARTYLLAAVALSVLFAQALVRVVAAVSPQDGKVAHGPLRVVALAAALLPTTPLITTTALHDGFLTAYVALALLVAAVVLALTAVERPTTSVLLLLAAGVPLLLTVWSLLALVLVPVVLLMLWRAVQLDLTPGNALRTAPPLVAGVVVGACAAAPLALVVAGEDLMTVLVQPGALSRPDGGLLALLVLGVGGWTVAARTAALRWVGALVLAPLLGGAATIWWLASLGEGPLSWTYYASKLLWFSESAFLWLLLVPAGVVVLRRQAAGPGRRAAGPLLAAVLLSSVPFVLADDVTELRNPVELAAEGWERPAAVNVAALRRFGDQQQPYVYWRWSTPSVYDGEDRIGNFWSLLSWPDGSTQDPSWPSDFSPRQWAYSASGALPELCQMVELVEGLVVVTRDPTLEGAIAGSCARPAARVVVDV